MSYIIRCKKNLYKIKYVSILWLCRIFEIGAKNRKKNSPAALISGSDYDHQNTLAFIIHHSMCKKILYRTWYLTLQNLVPAPSYGNKPDGVHNSAWPSGKKISFLQNV